MYNSKLLAITPSIEDTLDKQWFSHMIKHSAAIKKNHAAKICADIECSLLLCLPPSLLLHVLSHFSHVPLFATLWTVAHQAPLSMGFSRQEYWSGLPFPPPGDLPDPKIKPTSLASPALAGGFFATVPPGKPGRRSDCTSKFFHLFYLGLNGLYTPRKSRWFQKPKLFLQGR